MFIWKTKNKMKKHSRKGYETSKWTVDGKIERLTSNSASP